MKPDMLASHLEAYIGVREALGFQMRAPRILLREFVQFVNTEGDGGPIRAQLALDWANATSSRRGPSGAAYRLSIARGFLTYLRAAVPETQVPDHHLLAAYRRPKPFLFTVEQLAWLTQAALEEGPSGVMRPHTLAAVIGLMAGTGLRAGEVMRLVVDDVKLDHRPAYLHIRETKFHKSRLVPLHPSTVDPLHAYTKKRFELGYAGLSDAFFVSEQGQALNQGTLGRWFTLLCRTLGLWPTDGSRRPSLGSLRHSFAVLRLQAWYESGEEVSALLPHLSVYLGHVRPQETFWYLTSTPALLTAAADRFEAYALEGGGA